MSAKLLLFLAPALVFLALPLIAQDKQPAPACGPSNVRFDVNSQPGDHPTQPESGKALLYFIQDDSNFQKRPRPTTRLGMDGEWLGATHANSYAYFSVTPGVHHLCASWQPTNLGEGMAAAHFTAKAGSVYYFGVKNQLTTMTFKLLDSDEGQFLVSNFALSTSHPKK
jgi:hypothetical protein